MVNNESSSLVCFSNFSEDFRQTNCGVPLRTDRPMMLKWNSRHMSSKETGDHLLWIASSTNNFRWIWLELKNPHCGLLFCFGLIRTNPWFIGNRCPHNVPRAFKQAKRKSDESYISTIHNNVKYWWTEIHKTKITGKCLKLYSALWGPNMGKAANVPMYVAKILLSYRISALRIACSYQTASYDVISSMIPIVLLPPRGKCCE